MAPVEATTRYSVRLRLPRLTDAIEASLASAACQVADVEADADGVAVRLIVAAKSQAHAQQRIAKAVAMGGIRLQSGDFIAISADSAAPALF